MRKLAVLICMLNLSFVYSQGNLKVLESYIEENFRPSKVSKLALSNKVFENIMEMYLEDEGDIFNYPDSLNYYDFIITHFDFEYEKMGNEKLHNFSFKTGSRKFRKIRFSHPLISKDGQYAIFYRQEDCRRGLCGGGALILMEKKNGRWRAKTVLDAWIG